MTCANCRYCRERDEAMGICRRNPPSPCHGFPMVMLNDWCGEWASTQALRIVPPVEEPEDVAPQPLMQPVAETSWWRRVIG